ncbi:hypothetical protein ACFQL4_04340 [Halosimplex aquaticum]
MIGTTLTDIRERIEALATEDGSYYVVCGRTGERPVPAAGCGSTPARRREPPSTPPSSTGARSGATIRGRRATT